MPNYVPSVTSDVQEDTNAILVTWEPVPCGMIRGNGLKYQYQLDGGQIMDTFDTNVSLDALKECANHLIKVRACNDAGPADWSTTTRFSTRTISK